VLPPLERSRGRYHLYRSELAPSEGADGLGGVTDDAAADRPVVSLLGTALLPRRLWLSGRGLGEERRAELLRQATDLGFQEVRDPDDADLVAALVGENSPPQLTFTASGAYRHPADVGGPAVLCGAHEPLTKAVQLVVERILTERLDAGRMLGPMACA